MTHEISEKITGLAKHPVLELLETRGLGYPDSFKLALAIEGGGLGGALTGGMVVALEELGISPELFDIIIGTSAGAINGAYFLSGNAKEGVDIYTEHLAQHNFIDKIGWLKRRPILNLDILINHVMDEHVPLDWDKVVASQKLYSIVADPHQSGARILGPAVNSDELRLHLRATMHVAMLAGKPPKIDGVPYFDGSLVAPLPIQQAIDIGATHVLALSSRNLEDWRANQALWERLAVKIYDLQWPGTSAAIRNEVLANPQKVEFIRKSMTKPEKPPYVFLVDTPRGFSSHQLETSKAKLNEIVEIGSVAMKRVILRVPNP